MSPFPIADSSEVLDVSPMPPRRQGEVERVVHFDISPSREEMVVDFSPDYDFYLTEMKRLISIGKIEDHWHILKTDKLEEYASFLAHQVRYWDGSDPEPKWRGFRLGDLKRYLEK